VFSFRIFFCPLLLAVVPTAEAWIGLALPYDPPSGYDAAKLNPVGSPLKPPAKRTSRGGKISFGRSIKL
jgi:hypothetical protein